MRSAYQVLSRISEPPKPRLITLTPGKSLASVSQSRIDELPMNSTAPLGGGEAASRSANPCMSRSQAAWETCSGMLGEAAGDGAVGLLAQAASNAGKSRLTRAERSRFMRSSKGEVAPVKQPAPVGANLPRALVAKSPAFVRLRLAPSMPLFDELTLDG